MENIDYHRRITASVKDMPIFSPVVLRLIEIVSHDDYHLQDVVQVIENDASLTARVLRVANSAAFPARNPVDNIARAIPRLGMRTLVSIAVQTGYSRIYDRPLSGYESEKGELWDHSLRTAIAAKEIATVANIKVAQGLAYSAGLLHDMGKVVISEYIEGKAPQFIEWCDKCIVEDYIEAEREILSTDHAKIGYDLAKRWNFPKTLQDAIAYHHYPNCCSEQNRSLAYLVHLGDIVSMLGGSGTGADALVYKIQTGYQNYFQINNNELSTIMINVLNEFERTRSLIFIEDNTD